MGSRGSHHFQRRTGVLCFACITTNLPIPDRVNLVNKRSIQSHVGLLMMTAVATRLGL